MDDSAENAAVLQLLIYLLWNTNRVLKRQQKTPFAFSCCFLLARKASTHLRTLQKVLRPGVFRAQSLPLLAVNTHL
jgi:hypothetical protein